MSHRIITSIALGALLTGSAMGAPIVGTQFVNPSNGHTYFLLDPDSWTGSEAAAVTYGGHLATINDDAENTWIINTFLATPNDTRVFWIGLNDAANEGTFVWSSGETLAQTGFSNWFSGEPNNNDGFGGPENYVTVNWQYSVPDAFPKIKGKWNDDINTGPVSLAPARHGGQLGPFAGLVEVVPEPTSLAMLILAAPLLARRRRV